VRVPLGGRAQGILGEEGLIDRFHDVLGFLLPGLGIGDLDLDEGAAAIVIELLLTRKKSSLHLEDLLDVGARRYPGSEGSDVVDHF
jgi:hypothetical protein